MRVLGNLAGQILGIARIIMGVSAGFFQTTDKVSIFIAAGIAVDVSCTLLLPAVQLGCVAVSGMGVFRKTAHRFRGAAVGGRHRGAQHAHHHGAGEQQRQELSGSFGHNSFLLFIRIEFEIGTNGGRAGMAAERPL